MEDSGPILHGEARTVSHRCSVDSKNPPIDADLLLDGLLTLLINRYPLKLLPNFEPTFKQSLSEPSSSPLDALEPYRLGVVARRNRKKSKDEGMEMLDEVMSRGGNW